MFDTALSRTEVAHLLAQGPQYNLLTMSPEPLQPLDDRARERQASLEAPPPRVDGQQTSVEHEASSAFALQVRLHAALDQPGLCMHTSRIHFPDVMAVALACPRC